MNHRLFLPLFLGSLTLLRLLYGAQIDLSPDESYYFQWSQHLAPSYFSKGPGIALAIWLSTHLFGISEFGVRAFSPLLALGTSLIIAHLAKRLYDAPTAVWTVLLINCTPIFNAGSLVMTIDPLSIFFWAAALATAYHALEKSPAFSLYWPLTGALIGAGFLAKYTNALQLLSIALLLAFTPRFRRLLFRPGFASLLLTFALFTIPVLLWNAQHDWITLRHLGERGGLTQSHPFSPTEFLTYLGLHFGVYSPLIFGAMLFAIPASWKEARGHFPARFLLAFTLPLFLLYFSLALRQSGEPNWTAPATISLAILTVVAWKKLADRHRAARLFVPLALGLGAFLSILTIDPELLRRAHLPLSYDLDPSARLRGWRTAAQKVETIRAQYEASIGEPVFLIGNNYATSSILAFYLEKKRPTAPLHPPIYCPMSPVPGNQFYFWPRYDATIPYTDQARDLLPTLPEPQRAPLAAALAQFTSQSTPATPDSARLLQTTFLRALQLAAPELPIDENDSESSGSNPFLGRSALYITDRPEGKPADSIIREFAHCQLLACFDISRRGLPLRQIRVFSCSQFRQPEL